MTTESLKISSYTQLYGVIGDPIRHSKSPLMLNRAFAEAGIDAIYTAFHVQPSQLSATIAGVRAMGIGGLNVTIPHKEHVMELLDEIDESARIIGAVNTIVNREGHLVGYNTDCIGYVRSLKEETGINLKDKRILVLGAGGAARGVVYALALEHPQAIWVANRTKERAEALAESLGAYGTITGLGSDQVASVIEDVDVVINTTDLGMHPQIERTPLARELLHDRLLVSDIIYNPQQTQLLKDASDCGCQTHSGIGMFIYQGAYAFEYWTGQQAPVAAMRQAVLGEAAGAQ